VDLALYGRVLWRFKYLVFGGLILAVVLAVLSTATVKFNGGPSLKYRKPQTYQSSRTVLITQRGFPWGNANFDGQLTGRLSALPAFYAQLVTSAPVLTRLGLTGAREGSVSAKPVVDLTTGYGVPLPLLRIYAQSTSPGGAIALADRASKVFISYIAQQQEASRIPENSRTVLQIADPVQPATVLTPRKKTLPIMVFILVLSAAVGTAFVLENLRPTIHVVANAPREEPARKHPALEARTRD
jgi:capsular polysaccharide biosynthesis protein